jgi:hypothetical protein
VELTTPQAICAEKSVVCDEAGFSDVSSQEVLLWKVRPNLMASTRALSLDARHYRGAKAACCKLATNLKVAGISHLTLESAAGQIAHRRQQTFG